MRRAALGLGWIALVGAPACGQLLGLHDPQDRDAAALVVGGEDSPESPSDVGDDLTDRADAQPQLARGDGAPLVLDAGESGRVDARAQDAAPPGPDALGSDAVAPGSDAAGDAGGWGSDGAVDATPEGPPPPPTCPNGDGLFCGGNGVSGASNTLYCCSGGNQAVAAVCANGCQHNGMGVDDQCVMSTCLRSTNGAYCGGNGVPGCPSSLYDCSNGRVTLLQRCPSGCQAESQGLPDFCL